MGLMDLADQMMGGSEQGGDAKARLLTAVLGMIQNHPGGLQGLLGQFQQNGLGEHVASWVGTGENIPLDASQVQQAFGGEQMEAIVQQSGLTLASVRSGLGALLPEFINHLTPNGQVPQGEEASQGLGSLLLGFLG